MDLSKDVSVEYKDGALEVAVPKVALKLSVGLGGLLLPAVEKLEAKFVSGEIDLIKGTDIDKAAALQLFAAIKKELSK